MGFNKRHVSKQMILDNIKGDHLFGVIRELKIDAVLRADALILDDWAARFYHELNKDEREIRKELYQRHAGQSIHHDLLVDPDFKKLTSMSEALISLLNDPKWMDIYAVRNKLKFSVEKEENGKFNTLKEKAIKAILEYFDNSGKYQTSFRQ